MFPMALVQIVIALVIVGIVLWPSAPRWTRHS